MKLDYTDAYKRSCRFLMHLIVFFFLLLGNPLPFFLLTLKHSLHSDIFRHVCRP